MLGTLIIDKPEGLTSHDVVARVRRGLGIRRVGHTGTLDPFATGVLVVCIGRATRLVQFLVGLDKEYIATVRLGFATDTQDRTGKQITPLRSSKELSLEQLHQVLDQFTGTQLQTPPMYSAKKVGGEKLYHAARAGREVERAAVNITVNSLELIEEGESLFSANDDGTCDFRVRVCCSSGTYVRTLADDIGERLGVGAHLAELRRTRVGHFDVANALPLEDIERMTTDDVHNNLISPTDMLTHLPIVWLNEEQTKRVMNGRSILLSEDEAAADERTGLPLRLCDDAGKLVAVGDYDSQLKLVRARVVLGAGGV
jgi:tRNA pseudouridine55 synthase